MSNYDDEMGALISQSVTQDIPLSVEQFWSGFEDYLALQKVLGGHEDTKLLTGGGRPNNGVGAEIAFAFAGGTTREVLWQKDDSNHVWVMGIPEPNTIFSYYRATVGVWRGSDTARAKLTIDGVLVAENQAERQQALDLMAKFIPSRLGEICRFVLHRDGLRSQFELELNYDIEKFWAITSDWNNVEWVMGATKVEQLGEQVRQVWFGPDVSLAEKLLSTDDKTHTLVYSLLRSPMPVKMYEGTLTLTSTAPGKTTVRYESVYLVKDGVDAQAAKAGIDQSFGQRVAWMKNTFADSTPASK